MGTKREVGEPAAAANTDGLIVITGAGGFIGGLDWIRHQEVVSKADAEALELSGGHPPVIGTVGAHLGLGVRVFFSEWIAARLEFRDYLYRVSVPNWQDGGGAKRSLQNQLFTELGVSFFFPTQNRPVQ